MGLRGGAHPLLQGIKARGGTGGLEPLLHVRSHGIDPQRTTRAPRPFTISGMPDSHSVSAAMRTKGSSRPGASIDSVVAELAKTQFGVVGREQLRALGASEGWITRRVARGSLLRLHRGVYAVGHKHLDRRARFLGAVLACGPAAALSHRSAAELLGILLPSARAPEVTHPSAWRPRAGIVIHQGAVLADETQEVEGILTTGLSRTVLDLSARSSRAQVEQMLNEAEVRGLTDLTSIPTLLKRYPRRPGSVMLREIFREQSHTRGITKKELERRFKLLISSTDLPKPRHNADIAAGGRFFEADCLWAEQRLIVELDGRAVHGTPRAFEHDRERDRLLVADGWRVVRITWRQLRDEASAVVADLRLALARPLP